ncbi:MAG TPA: hypothetical protein ENK61_05220 [Devosia sp.]|nr:hypothetical protein [Devosia sp.]
MTPGKKSLKSRFSKIALALIVVAPFSLTPAMAINFGNNTSEWAYDGECDDPRFIGQGMAEILLEEDAFADASDCKSLYNKGAIVLRGSGGTKTGGSRFGDNSSRWANDGECDDPRFYGSGMAETLLDEDLGRDANDCMALYNSGQIDWR